MRLPPTVFRLAFAVAIAVPVSLSAQKILKPVEDLRIDADEQNLAPIWYLFVSPKGVMVASQQADRHFRFFGPDGKPLGTFGRKGGGPGEFQRIEGTRAGWLGDTLWLTEAQTPRLTLVGPDLKLLRVERLPDEVLGPRGETLKDAPLSYPYLTGVASDRSLLMTASLRENVAAPDWLPVATNSGQFAMREDRTGRFVRLLAGIPSNQKACQYGDNSASISIPYCPRAIITEPLDAKRVVLAIPGPATQAAGSFRLITVNAVTGDTILNREYRYRPIPIPARVIDSIRAKASNTKDYPPVIRDLYAKAPFATTYPPFRSLIVGRDGTLALETYTATGTKVWRFLSARGDDLGMVEFPRSVRIFAIERGRAWGTDGEEGDQDSIVRYRFP